MDDGRCVCGRPYYGYEGPCHYICDCCYEVLVNYHDATPGMIEHGFCIACLEKHLCNELDNEDNLEE